MRSLDRAAPQQRLADPVLGQRLAGQPRHRVEQHGPLQRVLARMPVRHVAHLQHEARHLVGLHDVRRHQLRSPPTPRCVGELHLKPPGLALAGRHHLPEGLQRHAVCRMHEVVHRTIQQCARRVAPHRLGRRVLLLHMAHRIEQEHHVGRVPVEASKALGGCHGRPRALPIQRTQPCEAPSHQPGIQTAAQRRQQHRPNQGRQRRHLAQHALAQPGHSLIRLAQHRVHGGPQPVERRAGLDAWATLDRQGEHLRRGRVHRAQRVQQAPPGRVRKLARVRQRCRHLGSRRHQPLHQGRMGRLRRAEQPALGLDPLQGHHQRLPHRHSPLVIRALPPGRDATGDRDDGKQKGEQSEACRPEGPHGRNRKAISGRGRQVRRCNDRGHGGPSILGGLNWGGVSNEGTLAAPGHHALRETSTYVSILWRRPGSAVNPGLEARPAEHTVSRGQPVSQGLSSCELLHPVNG